MCWLGVLTNKSQLGVDFKIRISFASQEKENKILCIANEEMETTTILDNSKSKEGQGDYYDQIKNVQDMLTRRVQVIKCEFCEEVCSKVVWFLKCLQSFYGVQFVEYSSYQESTVFMNFQNFLLNFK